MSTAVVVGAGPNGLAAAVRLAQHGIDVEVLEAADHIGGGTRTSELTVPGVLHDHCSAFHPMGVGSPYLRRSAWSGTACGGGGPRSTAPTPSTPARPGCCGDRSTRPPRASAPTAPLAADVRPTGAAASTNSPTTSCARSRTCPTIRSGCAASVAGALLPASLTARRWRTDKARALFGGVAAHAFVRCTARRPPRSG